MLKHMLQALAALSAGAAVLGAGGAPGTPIQDKVAVLVTDWGTPEGFSPSYYFGIGYRSRVGEAQIDPRDPCADGFVGTFPFRSQFGVYPHAVAYKTKGFEQAWDGMGVYKRSKDGKTFTSVIDAKITLSADDLKGATVFAMKDVPLDLRARTIFSVNKWDPVDYLADYVQVMKPNGIADVLELDVPYWMRVVGLLRPGVKADLNPMTHDMEVYLSRWFKQRFPDTVDIRYGNYEKIENVSRRQEDVAVDFAKAGYTKLLLTRETTDNNHYANKFATRSWIDRGLCQAGFKGKLQIDQIRQVGRTPEYNHMVVNNVRRYLNEFPKGSEVSLAYVTYGLPWPGSNPTAGPFSAPQPWINEVYHENAFNNFLSFKRAAEATLAPQWKLNFNKSGGMGGPDSRTNSLYAYGIFPKSYYGDADDPLRFWTIRDTLEQAIRVDGRKQIILVLSHWYYDGLDNALTIRETNDLPLNTQAEMRRGEFAPRWCERYSGPAKYEQKRLKKGEACPEGWSHIILTEAFDDFRNQFFEGYAQRIRGGVERFGVMPNLGVNVAAKSAISKRDGGTVSVTQGPLAGASLTVLADAHPDAPEGYTWAKSYRAAQPPRDPGNREAGAIRPFNEFAKASDHLTSAWDDFTAYIGTQAQAAPGKPLKAFTKAVSPAVLIGPYRELFNAPARITLPFNPSAVPAGRTVKPYIYNHITQAYEPVLASPGGAGVVVDQAAGRISFDSQVLGLFVAGLD
jgi:hypothetical protein